MSRNPINLKILPNPPEPGNGPSINGGKHLNAAVVVVVVDEMGQAIDRWVTYCKAEGLSEKTVNDYRVFINKFHWWYKAYVNLPPDEMTTEHAMAFVAYLKEKQTTTRWGQPLVPGKEKLSPASVASYARTARTFFNWLEERHVIDRSPFTRSVRITSKKDPIIGRHHKNLHEEQLAKIFEHLTRPERLKRYNGVRDLAIISLLLDSGMRLGELISMRVGDIDWPRKRVTIRGKTGERVCFYSKATEEALLAYHDTYRKKQKDLLTPNSPYWLTSEGNAMMDSAVDAFIDRISDACGFRFSAHRFRHTFATIMVKQVGVYELKEMLGHSNISTTMVYTHGNPDELQESYKGKSPLSLLNVGQVKTRSRRGRPKGSKNIREDEAGD